MSNVSYCSHCGQPKFVNKVSDKKQPELFPAERIHYDEYLKGAHTGVLWDANWMPGGPHYHGAQAKKMMEAWQKGFLYGLDERLARDKKFSRWWFKNHKNGRYLRYEVKS